MERIHISYLLIFFFVLLLSLVIGVYVGDTRAARQEKRERSSRLRDEAETRADREKAFSDKFGQ
jgi:hypothetical protein